MAGFTQGGPHLRGRIEHWVEGESETGAHFAKARITLTENSQALLADPRHGIALRGASTASVIRATLDQKSLQATLMDAVKAQSDWAGSLFGYGARDRSASMQRPM